MDNKKTTSKIKKSRKVEVVPYTENWKEKFNEESKKIKEIFGDEMINHYHIGSTSIPNIKAKPVIDILGEVKDIEKVDNFDEEMIKLGYEPKGENMIECRRFFMKGGNDRTHHIHIFQTGNDHIERHINFRDYMIAHPEKAKTYSDLKARLAEEFTYDMDKYIEGKDSFIKEMDIQAKKWKEQQNRG